MPAASALRLTSAIVSSGSLPRSASASSSRGKRTSSVNRRARAWMPRARSSSSKGISASSERALTSIAATL